jgi:hypothetical protein
LRPPSYNTTFHPYLDVAWKRLFHPHLTSHHPLALAAAGSSAGSGNTLVLKERDLLGEGAFSRVSEVIEDNSQRTFALKRMTKTAALQCPEHVYCEQHISKNTTNAFCIRQYASFKVGMVGFLAGGGCSSLAVSLCMCTGFKAMRRPRRHCTTECGRK